jgi:hypothetical protein
VTSVSQGGIAGLHSLVATDVPNPPAPPPEVPQPRSAAAADIEHTIRMMRVLPFDSDLELVVTVLRTTLDSLDVGIPELIEAASQRQADLDELVRAEHRKIDAHQAQIQARLDEIAALQAEDQEIRAVRKRLALVESVHRSLTTHIYMGFDL